MQKIAQSKKPAMQNSILNLRKKMLVEKRKRNQLYLSLNYLLNLGTFFDFFSLDAFNVLKKATTIAKQFNTKLVTIEHLFYAFFEKNSDLFQLFKKCGLMDEKFGFNLLPKTKSFSYFIQQAKEHTKSTKKIIFSEELNALLKNALINAQKQFKTPIVTSEILFLTLLECQQKNNDILATAFAQKKSEWYLVRYYLLKQIHYMENIFRSKIIKNHRFFISLLKTQLSKDQLNRLIGDKFLTRGLLFFRNELLLKARENSLNFEIEKEIYISIRATNGRKYL